MAEPTDEQWEASVFAYYLAGYEDEPDERDRMFWEAGFRNGSGDA